MIEKIKKRIIKYFENQSKLWGVEFESRLPHEYLITFHAEKRIKERVRVTDSKIMKMVVKASNSIENVTQTNMSDYEKKGGLRDYRHKRYFKSYMGYTWVFTYKYRKDANTPQKILITVY